MDSNFIENKKIIPAIPVLKKYWDKFIEKFDDDEIELKFAYNQKPYSGEIHFTSSGIVVTDYNKVIFNIEFKNSLSSQSTNSIWNNGFYYYLDKPLILYYNIDPELWVLYKDFIFEKDYQTRVLDFEERVFQNSTVNEGYVQYELLEMQMSFYNEMTDAMKNSSVLEINSHDLFPELNVVLERIERLFQ